MGIKITSNGAAFEIDNNQGIYQLAKNHIQKISIIRGDTLKIETGEDPLKNIFIPFAAITEPIKETIELMQEWMQGEMPVAGTGGGQQGTATEATQQLVLAELRKIAVLAEGIKKIMQEYVSGNGGLGNPDREDETQPFTLYRGWTASIEGNTGIPVWAIQKTNMEKEPYEITWADGNQDFDNQWDDRYNLNYS
jgi:hypothetical protein